MVFQDATELPYLEFVLQALRLIHPILFTANALKTMHVMAALGQEASKKEKRRAKSKRKKPPRRKKKRGR